VRRSGKSGIGRKADSLPAVGVKGGQFVLTPRRCTATHMTAIRSVPSPSISKSSQGAPCAVSTATRLSRPQLSGPFQGLDLLPGPPGRQRHPPQERRRRAAVEPVIGHFEDDHRMRRNHLKGREGDRIIAVLFGRRLQIQLAPTPLAKRSSRATKIM